MSEPSKRRQIVSWALFDFANSSFTTVIVTGVFNVWFAKTIAPDGGALLWNLAIFLSNAVIIVSAPLIGAIADGSSNKKRFLFVSYVLCVGATAALSLSGAFGAAWAVCLFMVANIAFASGENLVAGFLPDLAEPHEMGRVSAFGWGIGYAGGLGALALSLPVVNAGRVELVPLVVAAFFLVGGIPTFLWVKEKRRDGEPPVGSLVRAGFAEVVRTIKRRGELPDLFRFLVAYLIFSIGIYGVIGNAGIYAEKLYGLTQSEIIKVLITTQVVAIAGALLSGRLSERIGYARTVGLTVIVWAIAGSIVFVSRSPGAFWIVALLAGLAMGSSLAASRATVAVFTPPSRSGEIFGFWGLYGRAAAVLAAGGNALLLALTDGKLEVGIGYFVASFAVGLLMLRRVNEKQGIDDARR